MYQTSVVQQLGVALVVLWTSLTWAVPPASDPRLIEAERLSEQATKLLDEPRNAALLDLAQRAHALRVAATPAGHPARAQAEHLLGQVRHVRDEAALAETHYQKALALATAAEGPRSLLRGEILNDYALLKSSHGHKSEAKDIYNESISIINSLERNPNHTFKLAGTTCNAGLNLLDLAEHKHAGLLIKQANELYRKSGREASSESVDCINNLGLYYVRIGQPDLSIPYYQKALTLSNSLNGPKNLRSATILGNLASEYWGVGRAEDAIEMMEQSLGIREALLGPDSREVARALQNMSLFYSHQGLFEKSYQLILRSQKVYKKISPTSTGYGLSLIHMADLIKAQDDPSRLEEAGKLYIDGIGVLKLNLPPNHYLLQGARHNYANWLNLAGRYQESEENTQQELALLRQELDENSLPIALALFNLGTNRLAYGDTAAAEVHLRRALAIEDRIHGPDYEDLIWTIAPLAFAVSQNGRLDEAVGLLWRCLELVERFVRGARLRTSSAALDSLLTRTYAIQNVIYSLAAAHPSHAGLRALGLSAALLQKGRSLDELATRTALLDLQKADADTQRAMEELKTLWEQLAIAAHGGKESTAVDREAVRALRTRIEQVEQSIARRLTALRDAINVPRPAELLKRLTTKLPADSILFEVVQYRTLPKTGTSSGMKFGPLRYLGMTIDREGRSTVMDLGDADSLEAILKELRASLSHRNGTPTAAMRQLYQRVVAPLDHTLRRKRSWYFAPDGLLSLVPLGIAQSSAGLMIDRHEISVLTSGRDLLREPLPPRPASQLSVFANPVSTDPRYPALESADDEAKTLKRLFPDARLFQGPQASAAALLALQTPGILHIAAHGVTADSGPVARATRGLTMLPDAPRLQEVGELRRSMLETGLVLSADPLQPAPAGGTGTVRLEPSPSSSKSGIVAALQLAGMNPRGTQLVVLSTCSSGLGEVLRTQGVYGAQRALLIAGAETVVTSLWPVDDRATAVLMSDFYQRLLAGESRRSALRNAARRLRQDYAHPFYWAPFVVMGNPSPLFGMPPISKPQP